MREIVIVPSEKYADPDRVLCCCAPPANHCMVPDSGRRERTVIACLSLGVPEVVEPAVFYGAETLHLLVDDTDNGLSDIYKEFLEETRRQLKERLPGTYVSLHEMDTSDYHRVLRELLTIARGLDEDDVYVNISSGTPEYSAAAMLLCMQNSSFTAFTVRAKPSSLDPGSVRELMYCDGRPVGLMREVGTPRRVATFDPERQDTELVEAMAVIAECYQDRSYVTYDDIIEGLMVKGIWRYVPDTRRGRTDDSQKRRMFFRRTYIDPMVEKGWLVLDPYARRRFIVTAKGQAVIDVYHGLD